MSFDAAPPEQESDVAVEEPPASIRCPRCRWEPRAEDRWVCACAHVWNTFDTGGVCPGCAKVWLDTMCLACVKWSKHAAWYVE